MTGKSEKRIFGRTRHSAASGGGGKSAVMLTITDFTKGESGVLKVLESPVKGKSGKEYFLDDLLVWSDLEEITEHAKSGIYSTLRIHFLGVDRTDGKALRLFGDNRASGKSVRLMESIRFHSKQAKKEFQKDMGIPSRI